MDSIRWTNNYLNRFEMDQQSMSLRRKFDDSLMHVCEWNTLVLSAGNRIALHSMDLHFCMIIFQTASVANETDQRSEERSERKKKIRGRERIDRISSPLITVHRSLQEPNAQCNGSQCDTHTHEQMKVFEQHWNPPRHTNKLNKALKQTQTFALITSQHVSHFRSRRNLSSVFCF